MRATGLDLSSGMGSTASHGRWVRRGRTVVVDLGGRGSAPQQELWDEIGEELEGEIGGDPNVRWLQDALNRVHGAGLKVDGIAGPKTRAAVRGFQQRHGLQADGIAGSRTIAKLRQLLAGTTVPASARNRPNCARLTSVVLDEFELDKTELRPHHRALINEIVRCIAERLATDTEFVDIQLMGHADFTGPDAYNERLGLQRALRVEKALTDALNARGLSGRFRIISKSSGEKLQRPTPGQSRRVEVTLTLRPRVRPSIPPRIDPHCEAQCLRECDEQFRRCIASSNNPTRCLASLQFCMSNCRPRCLRPS